MTATRRGKRESATWFAENDGRVEALWERRARMIRALEALPDDSLKRSPLVAAIGETETALQAADQVVEAYA